jgi:hypothetical protein
MFVIIPDIVNVIIFIIFCFWYRNRSRKIRLLTKNSADSVLPSHYALEVKGFPSTVVNEEKVKDLFEKEFGPIEECKLAR